MKYNKIEIFDGMYKFVETPLQLLVFAIVYNLVEPYDFELVIAFRNAHLPDNPKALNQLIDKGLIIKTKEHLGDVYTCNLDKIEED